MIEERDEIIEGLKKELAELRHHFSGCNCEVRRDTVRSSDVEVRIHLQVEEEEGVSEKARKNKSESESESESERESDSNSDSDELPPPKTLLEKLQQLNYIGGKAHRRTLSEQQRKDLDELETDNEILELSLQDLSQRLDQANARVEQLELEARERESEEGRVKLLEGSAQRVDEKKPATDENKIETKSENTSPSVKKPSFSLENAGHKKGNIASTWLVISELEKRKLALQGEVFELITAARALKSIKEEGVLGKSVFLQAA